MSGGLIDAADMGVSVSVAQLENVGFGFDYALANTHARLWAREYGYELIRGLEEMTRTAMQEAVSRWTESGEPLSALRREIEPLFGKERAQTIAATEGTNAFAAGQEEACAASGVVDEMEACVAADELVCPRCGAMQGKRRPLRGTYPDGSGRPSWHPRCRCWERPVLRET